MTSISPTTPEASAVPVVGIGASAGGIEALSRFFDVMPLDSGCAFVVVLHLDPNRESELAHVLAGHTAMPVVQVGDGMRLEPEHVYVIAPNTDLTVKDGVLHMSKPREPHGHRHPVDVLFSSLAQDQHQRAIAIVLSGTGSNGTEGLRDIRAEGGMSLVQSPETAKFDGMPRSAITADMADHVLAPEQMPEIILAFLSHGYVKAPAEVEATSPDGQATLGHVIDLLRSQGGHDFRGYKHATLTRRVHRRLGLRNFGTLDEYLDELRRDPDEITALVGDLMISVTSFFRDAEAWKALAELVVVPMIDERETEATIRVWTTACSTGEEAYSLAMLITEQAEAAGKHFELKVFATDAQEINLRKARQGIFPAAALSNFPVTRLTRFFEKIDGSFQVSKELRDMVVFARHNLLRDPPFSRMDLVSCRNFLIYLEPGPQQRIIALFHFALRQGGHLFLGNAETIGRHENLFETVSKKWRIYRRAGATRHDLIEYPPPRDETEPRATGISPIGYEAGGTSSEIARRALLQRYAPVSVLIDQKGRVLYFHGVTGDYLENPSGEPTRDLLTMARDGLGARLRAAIREATKDNRSVTVTAKLRESKAGQSVEMTVVPLPPSPQGSFLLVSFAPAVSHAGNTSLPSHMAAPDTMSGETALQRELKATRAELQKTIEYQETTNEELKVANEEAVSMNEELQSTNEELETSKEELQSFNEELNTVNSQLQHKIGELETTTNDLNNLLAGSEVATLFLDEKSCIRWFAPATKELFDFIASDIGRPISHFAWKFADENLLKDVETVLTNLSAIEAEVKSDAGRWFSRRVLPYRTQDNRIAGVVLTFSDITERKHSTDAIDEARVYAETIVRTVQHPLLVLDGTLHVQTANKAFRELFAVFEEEPKGKLIFDLGTGEWNNPPLRLLLEKVLSVDEDIHNFEFEQDFHRTGLRSMVLTACKLNQEGGREDLILLAIEDITERKRFEEHREILVGELNHRIKNVMATVQAVASQTLSNATSMEEARATFGSRLIALGKSHDLLTRENWAGANLQDIVADTVEPHAGGSNRFRIEGPHLWLKPSAALAIAMALHELATNAAKYGALKVDDGKVAITWTIAGNGQDRRLCLRWEESGGPLVAPPTHKGFGSRLIQRALAMELGGQVNVAYEASGVVCTIYAPMPGSQERKEPD
ncbi:MAG: PAS domain-containing protein [Desulfomicrobium sp.]|uniref:chemotaxis protein CheB n=1 Tax=Hoeflea sp. TaxID=1940281 RepID=UPI0025BF3F4C|nr:chemotaxis protein CheB [Hoeflea sp.]MBU4530909.1 PAS domain-containing protein [Alphaproteobacteria bacterium]MBV1713123.1 PAS domain-containing protein [Desulfomicrobium sp.]MBU4542360.1 PAS domain-containing protein [Alphaproteobacteria bacterium]MBU4551124.1 PAS domain-containing protein [Alphaproteobacteria bacterium]MBV1786164.1 PAS domain-containing protein [Hoeflea sp.]